MNVLKDSRARDDSTIKNWIELFHCVPVKLEKMKFFIVAHSYPFVERFSWPWFQQRSVSVIEPYFNQRSILSDSKLS